jgi:hypothetical protein
LRMASIILAECAEIVNANRLCRAHSCPRNANGLKSRRSRRSAQMTSRVCSHGSGGECPLHMLLATKLCRSKFLPFLPQGFSGIIDRAPHLHNFPITI